MLSAVGGHISEPFSKSCVRRESQLQYQLAIESWDYSMSNSCLYILNVMGLLTFNFMKNVVFVVANHFFTQFLIDTSYSKQAAIIQFIHLNSIE